MGLDQSHPQKLAALRQDIHDRLAESDVYGKVRALVADFARTNKGATREEALCALKEKGVLDELLSSVQGASASANLRAAATSSPRAQQQPADGTHRHLHIRVTKARKFTEHLPGPGMPFSEEERFALSMQVLGHRHVATSPVSVNPQFDETFLCAVQALAGGEQQGPPAELRGLLRLVDPLRICVVRLDPHGKSTLVGTAAVEWRHVLVKGGHGTTPVQLHGVGRHTGRVTGVLDVRMELLPRPLATQMLDIHLLRSTLRLEADVRADAHAKFVAAAKKWWAEFTAACPLHRQRLVKVLARREDGEQRAVCEFVKPLRAGRLLNTPREAARVVALLDVLDDPTDSQEAWCHPHTVLTRGAGAKEEHALLLCALLLGFGLDAYVVVGKDAGAGAAWVVTRGAPGVTVWDPCSGLRYGRGQEMLRMHTCPLLTVGSLFNHRMVCANLQDDDALTSTHFDVDDPTKWHVLRAEEALTAETAEVSSISCMRRPTLDAVALEVSLEGQLRELLGQHRARSLPYGVSAGVLWDDQLSALLTPAMAAYETEALTGVAPGNDEFQQAVKRFVPVGHTFKAYPRHFRQQSPGLMAAALVREAVADHILTTEGDGVRLGLCVKVFAYPEDLVSVWVMLAVEWRGLEQ